MRGHRYNYVELLCAMSAKYGERLGTFFANRFAREIRKTGDFYITHIRVARADNAKEMEKFKKVSDDGCCGSKEWKVTFKSHDAPPVDYWLGFNFGH